MSLFVHHQKKKSKLQINDLKFSLLDYFKKISFFMKFEKDVPFRSSPKEKIKTSNKWFKILAFGLFQISF